MQGLQLSQYSYLSEFEVEGLTEGLAAEVPEAFIWWIYSDKSFQQKSNWLYHLSDNQVHCHGHVDLLICREPQRNEKNKKKDLLFILFFSVWINSKRNNFSQEIPWNSMSTL